MPIYEYACKECQHEFEAQGPPPEHDGRVDQHHEGRDAQEDETQGRRGAWPRRYDRLRAVICDRRSTASRQRALRRCTESRFSAGRGNRT